MSRYCAKPTCSEFVHTWFELSREAQRVVRRTTWTKHAIGLCESHADRFKVPVGWTFDGGGSVADSVPATRKGKAEDASPWFLPEGTVAAQGPVDGEPLTSGDGTATSADGTVSQLDNTEEGTMLDRAFHGPRQREATQSSASKQASSNGQGHSDSDETDDQYSTGEIPFPPHGRPVATI